jgi:hypothetical protein
MFAMINHRATQPRPPYGSPTRDRKGENPRQHLKLYRGALQTDAYAGFQHL